MKTASVQLVISQVGTSPPVALPAGAKIVKAPTSPTTPSRLICYPSTDVPTASSMARRSARARALGSSASVSHLTTTKCRAPAAIMAATVEGSTPPVTHTGHGADRTAWPT